MLILSLLCLACAVTFPVSEDEVRKELDAAVKTFDSAREQQSKAVHEWFDGQIAKARQKRTGSAVAVEKLQGERSGFEKSGRLPRRLPFAIRTQLSRASEELVRAYKNAADRYSKLENDEQATAVLTELATFEKSTQFEQEYLSTLKIERKNVVEGMFSTRGMVLSPATKDVELSMDGDGLKNSIFLHPPPKGTASVTYRLGKSWERVQGRVYIPRVGDETMKIGSKVTFQILGNGEVLWTSDGIQEVDVIQDFDLDVMEVELLEIRTSAERSNAFARAVWIEPTLHR